MDPSGDAQFQITHDGLSAHPAWSPDGTRIAFANGNDVYTMDEYGNDRQLVLDWDGQVGEIDWSPDGTRLVASLGNCAEFDCSPDIYVFALDGSGLTNVTDAPWDDEHPSWSPGGTKIAFDSIRAGQQDIYTVMPDGTGLTKVMPGADPDWKPDNSQLTAGRTWSPDGLAYATAAPAVGAYSAAGQELGHSTLGPRDFRHFERDWQPRASYPDPPFVPEGDYARPKGATPLRVSLVNAFDPCAPEVRPVNNTHGAPLSYPSCTRPHWASDYVINGTPDANNFPAEA